MFGGDGDDLLRGGGGADWLVGGDSLRRDSDIPRGSADRLEGGRPDVLDGQGGPDLLVGGGGRDTIDGGRGRDRIRARDPDRDWLLCGRGFDRLTASAADVAMRGCERREGPLTTAEGIVQWRVSVTVVSLIVACPVAAPRDCEDTLTLAAPGRPTATAAYSAKRGMATEVVMPTNFTDLDDAARQLNGAVASTVGDSVRFGDLPDGSTDSFLDALGVPRL
jgi:Ca2+-binding RTX toxin-like protein